MDRALENRVRGVVALTLVWLGVVTAMGGFFLPWVKIDVRPSKAMKRLQEMASTAANSNDVMKGTGRISVQIRQGTKTVSADLSSLTEIPRQLRGVDIPRVANEERTQVAFALAELWTGKPQQMGAKSYAVYAIPGMALLGGLLVTRFGHHRLLVGGVALFATAVVGMGTWKLLTLTTDARFVVVTIGSGMWASLGAYAVLVLGALLRLTGERSAA